MKRSISVKVREQLQKGILEVFDSEVKTLAPELQYILADDMVTAFHNRLAVLQRIQNKKA
jgi:hypothetical protein